jgi:hypothetical protein
MTDQKRDAQVVLDMCKRVAGSPWRLESADNDETGKALTEFVNTAPEALPYWINEAIAERTARERAEADNAAIVKNATEAFHMLCQRELTADTIHAVIDLLRPIAVEPHPGDELREELERLREDKEAFRAQALDNNAVWFKRAKEFDDKRIASRDEAKRYRDALVRICNADGTR